MSFFQQFPKAKYDFQNNGIVTNIVDLFRFIKVDDKMLDDLSLYRYYQIRNGDRPDVVSQEVYGASEYYWTFFIVNEQLKSGLTAWPMDSQTFDHYIETEYDGVVIETYPVIVRDGDGQILDHRNSLSGRFEVGETVVGFLSGATGKVVRTDVQLCQLVLSDVTGTFQPSEIVRGVTTEDSVTSYRVFRWQDAPHHYEDSNGLISYNAIHIDEQGSGGAIQPGTSDSELTPISNYDFEMQLNEERANIRIVRPESIYEFSKAFRELLNT
jgi:hypothetical protein